MVAKQVYYEGHVQGVGFRYTAKRIALGFEVCGWVRNLPDGRVELQLMGEDREVTEFLAAIQDSGLRGNIRETAISAISPLQGVKGFTIR